MNTRTSQGRAAPQELAGVVWRTSTRSVNGGGQCVEVGPVVDGSGRVAVRHSRVPSGPVFAFARDEWDAFLTGVKRGSFDFPE